MKRRRVHYGRLLFVIVVVLGIGLGAWKLVTSVLDDNATPSTPVENTNTPAEEETPKSADLSVQRAAESPCAHSVHVFVPSLRA